MVSTASVKQQVSLQRLYQQRLATNHLTKPEEVVAWLGAVQAQDYLGGKWAIAMRTENGTDDVVEQAFQEGRILRTHVMRPTWHFVTPDDIRWLLELTGPRVNALCGTYYRQTGLDEATLLRSHAVIERALEGGHSLTRAELGAKLEEAGVSTTGLRLGFIMMHAELHALVCSGPRRGKQQTYALLHERAPQAKSLPREEALAELTRRYFTSHGPATVRDFAWWSGLTVADVKQGIALLGAELEEQVIDGQSYWFAAAMPPQAIDNGAAYLLPTFDEFLVGFSGYDEARRNGGNLVFESSLLINGEVMGSWKRTLKKQNVTIEIAPFAPFTREQGEAIQAAAQRYGEFVGLPVVTLFV